MKGRTCFVLIVVLLFLIVRSVVTHWTGIVTFVSSGFWIPFIGWIALCLIVGAVAIRIFGGGNAFQALFRKGGEDTWWWIFFTSTVITCVIAMQSDWGHGLLLPKKGGTIESVLKPINGWITEASDGGLTILKPVFTGITNSLQVPQTTTTEIEEGCTWFDIAIGMVLLIPITFILAFKDNLHDWWKEAEKKAEARARAQAQKTTKTSTGTGATANQQQTEPQNKVTEIEVLWLSVLAEFIKDFIVYAVKGVKKL